MIDLNKNYYCIILAGGVGTRFWPVSRESRPKQFHSPSPGGKTFLRLTYERFANFFPPENIIVVSLLRYKELVKKEIPEIPDENILLEPYNRNTAPSITYASYSILKRNPDAVTVVSAADNMVSDMNKFESTIFKTLEYANRNDALMALGIIPDHPDTNFGYIQALGEEDGDNPLRVKTFTEKPDVELAEVFVNSGEFYWNSGIYVWRADVIKEELERYAPEITSLFEGWQDNLGTVWEEAFLEKIYTDSPKISVEYAVMEKTEIAMLTPSSFGWHDVGNWEALYSYLSAKDPDRNAVSVPRSMCSENKGTMIYSDEKGKMVIVKGLENYLVVDTDDVLLICPRNPKQIKEILTNIAMPDCEDYR